MNGIEYPTPSDVAAIRQVIEARIAEYRQDDTDLLVIEDDRLPEYGGGDPELADAIAQDVADRWDR